MILSIKQVLKITPVIPGSKEDLYPGTAVDHPIEGGEKAIITLKVKSLNEGDLNQVTEVIIIGPHPLKAKLTHFKIAYFTGTTITIFIDHIFKRGVRKEINQFIYEGGGLIAVRNKNYTSIGEQEDIFRELAHFMLTDTNTAILEAGQKSYILDPVPNTGKTPCHLSGRVTYNKDHIPPTTPDKKPMHHVATISCRDSIDVLSDYCNCHLLDHLSFYIDSLHSDEGWPIHPGQHSVQNYNEAEETVGVHQEDQGTEISLRPLYSIPEPDHALILSQKFSDNELKRYEALYHTYHKTMGLGKKHRLQLLGYPQTKLTCVAFEAESLYHSKAYSSIHYLDASQWQLLLQVSPETYQFPFFDTFGKATIYYMIKKQDLKDGNFSRIQVVVHKD